MNNSIKSNTQLPVKSFPRVHLLQRQMPKLGAQNFLPHEERETLLTQNPHKRRPPLGSHGELGVL